MLSFKRNFRILVLAFLTETRKEILDLPAYLSIKRRIETIKMLCCFGKKYAVPQFQFYFRIFGRTAILRYTYRINPISPIKIPILGPKSFQNYCKNEIIWWKSSHKKLFDPCRHKSWWRRHNEVHINKIYSNLWLSIIYCSIRSWKRLVFANEMFYDHWNNSFFKLECFLIISKMKIFHFYNDLHFDVHALPQNYIFLRKGQNVRQT